MAKTFAFFLRDTVSLRYAGFFLFIASFVAPTWNFESFGFSAFITTAEMLYHMFADGDVFRSWDEARLGAVLAVGWLSNFSVFFRLPLVGALAMMLAPWAPYLALLSPPSGRWPDMWFVGFIPFYPWAIGIGLIQYARVVQLRHMPEARSKP